MLQIFVTHNNNHNKDFEEVRAGEVVFRDVVVVGADEEEEV